MKFTFNDGGRVDAGYKGLTRDCVCRSIAIATGITYQTIYDALNEEAKLERFKSKNKDSYTDNGSCSTLSVCEKGRSSARTGMYKATIHRFLKKLGWTWVPTMQIGSGCKVHLKADELPMGRLIVSVSKHMTAVIDGTIHDTHNPSRDGTRCVYGYWIKT